MLLLPALHALFFFHSRISFLSGHSDWVKSISFSPSQPDASLILASGSQDCTIRLTRIFSIASSTSTAPSSVGTFGQKLQAFPSCSLSSSPPLSFVCELYSVLRSHTDWVHSVRWLTSSPHLALFSASADKSIALWKEGADGVWCETRAGRIGGGVMSFCGGACSNSGDRLMAHSHTGSGCVMLFSVFSTRLLCIVDCALQAPYICGCALSHPLQKHQLAIISPGSPPLLPVVTSLPLPI